MVETTGPASIADAEVTWQVAGEIPQRKENKNVLRQGFTTAVILVGILYLCVVAVFVSEHCLADGLRH